MYGYVETGTEDHEQIALARLAKQVLFTTEDLHRWGRTFSFVMVTTREWAQDPVNMRLLQYFTAVAEVYDAQYALQVSSLAEMRLGPSSGSFHQGSGACKQFWHDLQANADVPSLERCPLCFKATDEGVMRPMTRGVLGKFSSLF